VASGAARRYAQAVLSLAKEQSTLDAWLRDLARLNDLMGDERAREYFASPNVPIERKRAILDEALAGAQPAARNLAHLLLERRRLEIVPELFALFEEGLRAERGIVVADVTTATELGPRERLDVAQRLGLLVGKQVELRLHVDPEIIGGVVARVGDLLIDGSVAGQLRRLHSRLSTA
jgi:F-type H+-transporting ATPase subunit delta